MTNKRHQTSSRAAAVAAGARLRRAWQSWTSLCVAQQEASVSAVNHHEKHSSRHLLRRWQRFTKRAQPLRSATLQMQRLCGQGQVRVICAACTAHVQAQERSHAAFQYWTESCRRRCLSAWKTIATRERTDADTTVTQHRRNSVFQRWRTYVSKQQAVLHAADLLASKVQAKQRMQLVRSAMEAFTAARLCGQQQRKLQLLCNHTAVSSALAAWSNRAHAAQHQLDAYASANRHACKHLMLRALKAWAWLRQRSLCDVELATGHSSQAVCRRSLRAWHQHAQQSIRQTAALHDALAEHCKLLAARCWLAWRACCSQRRLVRIQSQSGKLVNVQCHHAGQLLYT